MGGAARAEIWKWLKANALQALLMAVLSALVSFFLNLFYMTVVVRNYTGVQPGSGMGRYGALSWGLLSTVLCGLFSYGRAVGWKRMGADFRSVPRRVGELFRRDGAAARVHLFWGAATSLVVMFVIAPYLNRWVGGLFGIGLVLSLPTILGRWASGLLLRLYSALLQRLAPTRQHRVQAPVSMAVGILGSSLALVAGTLLGGPLRLVAAAVCAYLALTTRKPPLATVALLVLGFDLTGWAQDLDTQASHSGLADWLRRCSGRHTVEDALIHGAAPAGLGGTLGSALGGVAGNAGYGWPPSPEEQLRQLEEEVQDPDLWRRLQELKERSKDAPIDENELAEITQRQNDLRRRRLAEIDRQHEQQTEEFRQRTAAEEQARAAARQREIDDLIRRERGLIDRVADPEHRQWLQDFIDRHKGTPDDYRAALEAIRKNTFEADQQRTLGESEESAAEAAAIKDSEKYAREVRDWASRANRVAGKFVPGGDKIADIQDAIYGGIEGYDKEGLRGVGKSLGATAIDRYADGAGSALKEADGDFGKAAKGWVDSKVDRYDPSKYAERIKKAEGLGDLVDVGLDAYDAGKSARDFGDRMRGDHEDRPTVPHDPETGDTTPPRVQLGGTSDDAPRRKPESADPPDAPFRDTDQRDNDPSPSKPEERFDAKRRDAQQAQDELRAAEERQRKAKIDLARSADEAEKTGSAEDFDKFKRAQKELQEASDDLPSARDKFDKAREDWLNQDPRAAARKARQDQEQAMEDGDQAQKDLAAATDPQQKAEAQKRWEEAQERERRAEEREKAAVQRVEERQKREEKLTRDIDRDIQTLFNPKEKPTGNLRISENTAALAGEANEMSPKKPINVNRVDTPETQIAGARKSDVVKAIKSGDLDSRPVTGPDDKVPDGHVLVRDGKDVYAVPENEMRNFMNDPTRPGARPDTETVPQWSHEKGQMGLHPGGPNSARQDSLSLPSGGTAVHERIHAHTSQEWLRAHGDNRNLTEGLTEHYAQQVLKAGKHTDPQHFDRSGHYPEQVEFVRELESKVGAKALKTAFFDGDMNQVYEKLGNHLPGTDPAAARISGKAQWDMIQNFVNKGQFETAKGLLQPDQVQPE